MFQILLVGRKIVVWKAFSLTTLSNISLLLVRQHAGEVNVSLFAVGLCCRDAAKAVVDNLCLRQQLLVLQRRQPRPGLTDSDRRFWILAYRWFSGWRTFAHRKTRNCAAVAPAGVAELLASAFKPERQDLQGLSH